MDAENAPTGLCKTADGFAQLPHASSRSLSDKHQRPKPLTLLVSDPQILRRRQKTTAVVSGPATEAVPASAAADYEALRSGVLEGIRGDHDMGLALLMRRGMAAWIRAWSACTAASVAPDRLGCGSAPALSGGLRPDVARLLVTMALTAYMEAHP